MDARLLTLALTLGVAVVVPAPARAQAGAVQYTPPAKDLAPRRVGGNTRGLPEAMPAVAVLAPDHLALTVSERPTLFWYLSAPTTARIELVVVDPRDARPVVEAVVAGERAGIQAFSLAERGVRLEPGVAYEWSVAVVADPAQRSRDVVAGGAVQRIEPSAALQSRLAGAGEGQRAVVLAAAGIWYDALAALSAGPDDAASRARRAAVLEQAGLPEVAAFERRP
jgi:hypothetical protein